MSGPHTGCLIWENWDRGKSCECASCMSVAGCSEPKDAAQIAEALKVKTSLRSLKYARNAHPSGMPSHTELK
eukprot:596986-Prymnesium_polylepis.1